MRAWSGGLSLLVRVAAVALGTGWGVGFREEATQKLRLKATGNLIK